MPRTRIALLFLMSLAVIGVFNSARSFADEPQPKTEQATAEKPEYLLRYSFETGDVVHFQVTDKTVTTTRKNQLKETVFNQSDVWRHFWVAGTEGDAATLELVIDRVRLTAQFDGNPPTIFDSSDKSKQPDQFRSILETVGKPLNRMRVNTRGEMLSLQNMQGGPTADESDPAVNFLVIFPEEAVQIGDSWKQSLEVEVPVTNRLKQNVKLLRTYTLKNVENDVAEIGMSTIVASPVRDPAIRTRLMLQTPSGTIRFDLKNKQIAERETKVDDVIVGAFGPGTLVEAKSSRTEKQVETPKAAQSPDEQNVSQTK